jgi:hypothetical protein
MRFRALSAIPVAIALIGSVPFARAMAADANINRITRVDVKEGPDGVTVTVQGSKPPNFTTFSMSDPPRFVIDFSESSFQGVPEDIVVNNSLINLVKNLSYGSEQTSIARVMLAFALQVDQPDVKASGNALSIHVLRPGGAPVAKAAPAADDAHKKPKAEVAALAPKAEAEAEKAPVVPAAHAAAEPAVASAPPAAAPAASAAPKAAATTPAPAVIVADSEESKADKVRAEKEAAQQAKRDREAAAAEARAQKKQEAFEKARLAKEAAEKAKEERAAKIAEAKAARKEAAEEKARAAAEAREQKRQEKRARAEAAAAEKKQEPEVAVEGKMTATATPSQLKEVGFKQLPEGSRVFVRTSEHARFNISEEGEKTIVLELENTVARRRNDIRHLDTSFFPSAVAMVTPKVEGNTYVLEIKLREKVPYQQRQEGDMLALDFDRPASVSIPSAPAQPPSAVSPPAAEKDAPAAEDAPAQDDSEESTQNATQAPAVPAAKP